MTFYTDAVGPAAARPWQQPACLPAGALGSYSPQVPWLEVDPEGLSLCQPQGMAVPGSELIPPQANNGLSIAVNVVVLLAIAIGVRLLAFLLLLGVTKTKRL